MNRIALVTGASRGLGLSIAKKFLAAKDIVYVNYNSTPISELQEKYKNEPYARFLCCDVSNEENVKNMINQIKEEEGHLDILINNAGIAIDTELQAKTKENFQKILDVNLIGPFLTSKYAKDIMDKGSIINISSNTGIDAYYSYSLDYDASKAGLINLTHNFAKMYAPSIRVNCICPGWINTEMNQELDEEYIKEECEHILLNRFANPEEIANVVFFLTSDEASYMTDSIIRVDGGLK